MDHSPGFLRLAQDALTRVHEISIEQLRRKQAAQEHFHFIDAREDSEWAAGHCPGANHLGRGILERDIEKIIPDLSAEIVLYCGGGYRSALAADSLQKMGYTNVHSMTGGIRRWRELGLPEEH